VCFSSTARKIVLSPSLSDYIHSANDLSHMLAHTARHLAFLARRVSEVDSGLAAESHTV
jgi:hypothetical protein